MKLITSFAVSAIIGTSMIASATEARNEWKKVGCFIHEPSECRYIKVISKNNSYVTFNVDGGHAGVHKRETNCNTNSYRFVLDNESKSNWLDATPGSMGEDIINLACR